MCSQHTICLFSLLPFISCLPITAHIYPSQYSLASCLQSSLIMHIIHITIAVCTFCYNLKIRILNVSVHLILYDFWRSMLQCSEFVSAK